MGLKKTRNGTHNGLHLVPKKQLIDVPEVRKDYQDPEIEPRVDLKIAMNTDGLTVEDVLVSGIKECGRNGYIIATIVIGPSGTLPQILGNVTQKQLEACFAIGFNMIAKGTVIEDQIIGREN